MFVIKSLLSVSALVAFATAGPVLSARKNDATGSINVEKVLRSLNSKATKPYKVEEIPALTIVPNAKRTRIVYGPYKLKGTGSSTAGLGNFISMDSDGTSYVDSVGPEFPRHAVLVDMVSYPANESLHKVDIEDGFYNHHAVIMNLVKRADNWVACGSKPIPDLTPWSLVVGSGNGEIVFPGTYKDVKKYKTGTYVGKNDPLSLSVDVVNYNKEDRNVFVYSEIEYIEGQPAEYVHGEQRQIQMGVCDTSAEAAGQSSVAVYASKNPKQFVMTGKRDIDITRDGILRAAFAHLHDGGVNMLFNVNGKQVCNSTVEYGGPGFTVKQADGKIWEAMALTTGCPDEIEVRAGDKLQLSAHFDFAAHPPRNNSKGHEAESMALADVTFYPVKLL